MAKNRIGPRIATQTAEFFSIYFPTVNQGAQYSLDSAPALFYLTVVYELRTKKFTRGELMTVINAAKPGKQPGMLNPEEPGQQILKRVQDAIEDGAAEKWQFDGAALVKKIEALTYYQTACLEVWAQSFWVQVDREDGVSIDGWIGQIIPPKKAKKVKK